MAMLYLAKSPRHSIHVSAKQHRPQQQSHHGIRNVSEGEDVIDESGRQSLKRLHDLAPVRRPFET